jgi:hypothetical protein
MPVQGADARGYCILLRSGGLASTTHRHRRDVRGAGRLPGSARCLIAGWRPSPAGTAGLSGHAAGVPATSEARARAPGLTGMQIKDTGGILGVPAGSPGAHLLRRDPRARGFTVGATTRGACTMDEDVSVMTVQRDPVGGHEG